MDKILELKYQKYTSLEELIDTDMTLITEALSATQRSVAPHSGFRVGAAARLRSGAIVYGANVESEVYPAGICAERNLLFAKEVSHPGDDITALAIVSLPNDNECYPCGFCRQSLLDAERRQGSPIRIIMASGTSATIVASAEALVPFSFKL